MSTERLLSIHKTLGAAIRSQRHEGPDATVKEGVKGTTPERPWGVVMPSNKDSRKGP